MVNIPVGPYESDVSEIVYLYFQRFLDFPRKFCIVINYVEYFVYFSEKISRIFISVPNMK
jgi:hypothetical protein